MSTAKDKHRTLKCPPFCLLVTLAVSLLAGCTATGPWVTPLLDPGSLVTDRIAPSNFRNWAPNLAVLSYADVDGDQITVHNIRNCNYLSKDDYVLDYYDRTFLMQDLRTVDFIIVPFQEAPLLAHTMLSFGLANGEYIVISAEVRLEEGESYSPVRGFTRQYEIIYVVADERDLIRVRTRHRGADVYVYRARATPQQVQQLFADAMNRVNKLAASPEFYNTLTNNCTTNVARHVNGISPNRIPYGASILLPGYSDRYAYDLGLLATEKTFEETKRHARVNALAEQYYDNIDFSAKIRQ